MERKMRYIILAVAGILLVGLPVLAHSEDGNGRERNATQEFNVTRVTGTVEFVSSDVIQVRGATYNIQGARLESESDVRPDMEMFVEGAKVRLHVDMRDNSVLKMVLLQEHRLE